MNVKGINVEEYVEDFDGSIDGCFLLKDLGDGAGLYNVKGSGNFVIINLGKENEYIWKAV